MTIKDPQGALVSSHSGKTNLSATLETATFALG